MNKKNTHGFTLIEAVVSFAILAIASTMIIVGIVNITNLFAEAALIKDTTNSLYENINSFVYDSDSDNIGDFTTVFFKIGNNRSVAGYMIAFEETINYGNPVKVRLSRFYPEIMAEQLPEKEVEEEKGIPARFFIAESMKDIPIDQAHFVNSLANYFPIGTPPDNVFADAIKEDYDFKKFKTDVNSYLLKEPSAILIGDAYNQLDENYKTFLNKECKIKWFYASYNPGGTEDFAKVYGYFEPQISGPGICIKYGNKYEWLPYSLGFEELVERLDPSNTANWYNVVSGIPEDVDNNINKEHLKKLIKLILKDPSKYSDIIYIEANMK